MTYEITNKEKKIGSDAPESIHIEESHPHWPVLVTLLRTKLVWNWRLALVGGKGVFIQEKYGSKEWKEIQITLYVPTPLKAGWATWKVGLEV